MDSESDEPPSATLGAPGIEIPVLAVGAAAGRELGREVELEVDAVSERRRTVNVLAETPLAGHNRASLSRRPRGCRASPALRPPGGRLSVPLKHDVFVIS